MQYKSIEIEDKKIFDEYYKLHKQYSEYLSFTTLFTWKNYGKYRYIVYDGEIIVKLTDDEETYLLPQMTKESIKKVIDFLSLKGKVNIKGAVNKQAEIVKKLYGDRFCCVHKRDGDNYYYLSENLISLSGKKLHSKRNFVNRFKRQYNYTYEPITEPLIKECIDVLKEWCERKECKKGSSMKNELNACSLALLYMNELGLKGGAIRIDGKISAFTLGEQLNDETVVIHFEKADTKYDGIYQTINNEFLKNEWPHIKYVNREEDMGIEGLRKAKLSYYPEFLLKCYDINDNN